MPKISKKTLYLGLIGLLAVASICVLVIGLTRPKTEETPLPNVTPAVVPETRVVYKEVKKLVEVEKTISSAILEDGLKDMGVLVTEEYYFTEVISFSSVKKLLRTDIDLKFTESAYLASYDGNITAGIDFAGITAEKDDEAKKITVTLPAAKVFSISVDPDSFVLYSEKVGLGNPLSAKDFNASLAELENTAREKALDRGLLERADENAEQIIENFIAGLVDLSDYSLQFKNK